MNDQRKTHFGYHEVDWNEKANLVKDVFDSVADNYDLMNDVMSFGIHRLWKSFTIHASQILPGDSVLDLAGGTGDLSLAYAEQVGPSGQVILCDINDAMLRRGRDRMIDNGVGERVICVEADAEKLPFPENYFNNVTIAFGLRNVTDKNAALRSMYRTLKPGGKCLILEFSQPGHPVLQQLYDAYSFTLLPTLGEWFAKDRQSYQYLAESIRKHPDQETLKSMILAAGFDECTYQNLTGGIASLHIANKY